MFKAALKFVFYIKASFLGSEFVLKCHNLEGETVNSGQANDIEQSTLIMSFYNWIILQVPSEIG